MRRFLTIILALLLVDLPVQAANINYTETDSTAVPCTGLGNARRLLVKDGTAGSSEISLDVGTSQGQKTLSFQVTPGAGVTWGAGTVAVRINVTTAEMSAQVNGGFVLRYNSSCVSQETLGSLSVFSIGTAGTYTDNVTITAATSPASTDVFVVNIVFNSSSHSATIGITPSLIIDTPINDGTGPAETTVIQTIMIQ